MIQQGGEFTLPEFSFQWWDSKNQRLESVVIKGEVFEAANTFQSFIKAYMSVFVSFGLAVVSVWHVIRFGEALLQKPTNTKQVSIASFT